MPAPDAIRKRPGSPVLFGLPFRLDDLDGHRLDRLGRLLPGQLALELFLGLLLLLLVAGLAASCRHAITPIPWLAPVGRASKLKYPIRSRRCHGNRALRRAPATTVAPPSSAKSACRSTTPESRCSAISTRRRARSASRGPARNARSRRSCSGSSDACTS